MKPTIVVILGSSKFKSSHLGIAQRETLRGKIVLLTGFWHHVDMLPITDEKKHELDELMMRKIELADECIVCNPNGYVGQTTKRGIEYAGKLGKSITYMERIEP